MNRFVLRLILASILAIAGAAETTAPKSVVEPDPDRNVFSLLPKAFQKNPLLDQTVITEMTPAGRKIPPPTSDHPAYYVIQSGGRHDDGHRFAREQPPTEEALRALIRRVLSAQGYLPTDDSHPPSLLLVYHWGSSNPMDTGDADTPAAPYVSGVNLLSNAALVGGERFAQELGSALQAQELDDYIKAHAPLIKDIVPEVANPFRRFLDRDDRTRQLVEQVFANCYYAIVSAYDYASIADGRRQLLWRTKMTVDANGVSMTDSLPALIVSAGKYFGQDMSEAAILNRRLSEGRIKLGDLEIKEYLSNPTEKKTKEPEQQPSR